MEPKEPTGSSTIPSPTLPPNSAAGIEETSEFLWNVQKYINDYLRFGDTKAGLSVATVSAIIGALLKADAQSSLYWRVPVHCSEWFPMLAFVFLGMSAVLGIAAVTPPFRQPKTPGLMYWAEVASHGSEAEYWQAVRGKSREELTRSLSRHVFIVSSICRNKYRLILYCIVLGVIGAVFAALFALSR